MKSIESKEDLIKWSTEINHGVTLSRKCDMQDIYAHSSREYIDRFFIECEGDRKLVICSVNNCMAFDEVERLLNVLAYHKVKVMFEEEQAEIEKHYEQIRNKEIALDLSKKFVYRKIETHRKESEYFQDRMVHFRDLYQRENTKRLQAQDKANKFDKLKSILS